MAQITENKNKEILEAFVDEGYHVEEEADHVTTLWFKDDMFAAFSQVGTTAQNLRDACLRHKNRLNGGIEIKRCCNCTHWHYAKEWLGNCWLHRWDKDRYSQDATPDNIGCKEYADRCVPSAREG